MMAWWQVLRTLILRSVARKADLPVVKRFSSPGRTADDMIMSVVRIGLTNMREWER